MKRSQILWMVIVMFVLIPGFVVCVFNIANRKWVETNPWTVLGFAITIGAVMFVVVMTGRVDILGILALFFGLIPTLVIIVSYVVDKEWTETHRGTVYVIGVAIGAVFFVLSRVSRGTRIRYMPRGNITIISRWEVRRVNRQLGSAKCPVCRSSNLLWYQYGSKCLASDTPIYIRCQNCSHDDYTDL